MKFEITENSKECPKSFYAEKVVGYDWHSDCENPKVSNFTNFGICDQDPVRETQQNIQNWLDYQRAKDKGLWTWNPKEYKYRSNYDI